MTEVVTERHLAETSIVGERPKVMLAMRTALGWNTYANQVTTFSKDDPDRDTHIFRFDPSAVERMLVKRHNNTKASMLYRRVSPVRAFKGMMGNRVRNKISEVSPDIVHFSGHFIAAAHAFRSSGIPFTMAMDSTVPCMERLSGMKNWSRADREIEREMAMKAERIYPVSKWVADSLVDDYGVPAERIRVIPFSIDMRGATKPDLRNKKADELPRIIFVGNDFLRKGGDKLHRWVTGPLAGMCELHIVSKDPKANLGGENVVYHGGLQNADLVNRLIPQMDLMCHPTQSDMSAIVVGEAARSGVPAIASSVGGIPELIRDGKTGYLLERDDEEGFVAKLRELISDHEKRWRMGQAACDFAWATLDAQKNYNTMLDEIEQIARAHKRGSGQ